MQSGQPQGASRPNKRPRGGSRGGRGGGGGGGAPRRPNAAQAAMEGITDTGPSTPIDSPVTLTRAASPVQDGAESSRGFTTTRFTDFLATGAISKATADGIGSLRPVHEFCTPVQAATLPVILTGVDVLAQAKTGTGKTLAFLIPSVENLVKSNPQPRPGQISVLIMSPTRELAIQIEEAARTIMSATPYRVQHVVGGTNMSAETKRLNNERCDILVATPGRLQDHMENGNLKAKFSGLRALILDEADRLLEQGFRREIEKIINMLPNRQSVPRQTLLFSATIPAQVHQVAALALLPNHKFITTISEADANTHLHVPQHLLIAQTLDQVFPLALATIRSELAIHGDKTKMMCFYPTARATGLAAALFKRLNLGMEVLEIHSRKSQSQRNQAAEQFKGAKSGILFSSDVTARGMDFPGVTTVLQVGVPAAPEQYIHRLGRTARAGASGSGILILAQFETFFLRKREITALPLKAHPAANTDLALSSPAVQQAQQQVNQAMLSVDDESKAQYYSASLGFYKAFLHSTFGSADAMVATMNAYAVSKNGLAYKGGSGEVPPIMTSTVGKMGLRGTQGLNLVKELPGKEGRGGGGGGGGRGGGGGGRGGGGGGRGGGRGGSNNMGGGGRGGGGGGGGGGGIPGLGRGGGGGGGGGRGGGRGGARGGRGGF